MRPERLGSSWAVLGVLIVSTLGACQGLISAPLGGAGAGAGAGAGSGAGGPGGGSTGGTSGLMCGGSSPALQSPPPLRRLDRDAYMNVLADVVRAWAPTVAAQVLSAQPVVDAESQFGPDSRVTGTGTKRGGFRRLDQGVEQAQVDATFATAQAIATELTRTSARIAALLGTCASDADAANDAACVQSFIQRAGRIAQRRALEQDDVDFYTSVYASTGIDPRGVADLVTVLLTSPYLFYQVEHGGDVADASTNVYALSGQELANRLSLQFWGTIPDAALTTLVDSGRILTEAGYAEAVAHVAADPRMQAGLGGFYREYLSLEDLGEMDRLMGTPRFDAVRGSFTPTSDTRENMIDEVTRLALYYTTKADGTFSDLFTTTKSFATTADVATIYGAPVWSGVGDPPDMPDSQHVGLLTHAGMVATGAAITRPIIKGVTIRTVLLCDQIGTPPANAMMVANDTAAMLDPRSSTRSLIESMTQKRSDCSGCHLTQINPLGFPTESFDPLGRVRQMETVFDDAGTLLGTVPIDTSSTPRVIAGDTSPVANAAELQTRLLASHKLQECLARKYFRFTFGTMEDVNADACTIQTLSDGLVMGKPLGQVLLQLATTPAFKQRRFN